MYLSLLVFVCGGAVMVLEIVGSRFFAPYIGTSIAVWTSLIGVVMAGLSAGYALGGWLGDHWRSLEKLRIVVAFAGVWTLLLTIIRDPVLTWLSVAVPSLTLVAVLGTAILLVVPSVLLGMVSPYAVRLVTRDVAHVGRAAGNLAAISTIGSIVGTFLAGFALIPSLGTTTILAATALVLVLTAACRCERGSLALFGMFLILLVTVLRLEGHLRRRVHARASILIEVDTPYSVVRVRQGREPRSGRTVRLLEVDRGYHAAVYLDRDREHVFGYTKFYQLVDAVRPQISRALLLGGGGYTVARDFLARHPEGWIDVVEIDPVVTQLAVEYFGLRPDDRMSILHEDARSFLNRGGPPRRPGEGRGRYHVVFGDVFRSRRTIPFHLTTREAVGRVADLLDDRGVYLLNVIASLEGPRSRFLRAELRTLKTVFPTVLVFAVPSTSGASLEGMDTHKYQNFLLLASKVSLDPSRMVTEDPDLVEMLQYRLRESLSTEDVPLLVDDYAPVEAMLNF